MSNFFNPGSPRFRRGTIILSTAMMGFAGAHIIMADFGSQKHVFTDLQVSSDRITKLYSFFFSK
jgi:hypothetical protein